MNKERDAEIISYFTHLFASPRGPSKLASLELVECKVTNEMNEQLLQPLQPYMMEEVGVALHHMHLKKAPGPMK